MVRSASEECVPPTITERYYPFYNCRPNDAGDLDWENSKKNGTTAEEVMIPFFFFFATIVFAIS